MKPFRAPRRYTIPERAHFSVSSDPERAEGGICVCGWRDSKIRPRVFCNTISDAGVLTGCDDRGARRAHGHRRVHALQSDDHGVHTCSRSFSRWGRLKSGCRVSLATDCYKFFFLPPMNNLHIR